MDRWAERFERAGVVGRLGLLTGGAVRLAAGAAETALDRAASIAVEAREAFRTAKQLGLREKAVHPRDVPAFRAMEKWE